MKKEVFLAISIGFVLGLVITFGIWTANKSLKSVTTSQPAGEVAQTSGEDDSQTPAPTPPPDNKITLNISSPEDEILVNTSKVTMSGNTVPNASVAILYETGQTLISADDKGDFSFDIPLEGGYNRIQVKAFDQSGQSSTKNLTITYTTQKI